MSGLRAPSATRAGCWRPRQCVASVRTTRSRPCWQGGAGRTRCSTRARSMPRTTARTRLRRPRPAGTGEPLAVLPRPGNAGSNTADDHFTIIRRALAQLPGHQARRSRASRTTLIRADGAGPTRKLVQWLATERLSYPVGFVLPDNTPACCGTSTRRVRGRPPTTPSVTGPGGRADRAARPDPMAGRDARDRPQGTPPPRSPAPLRRRRRHAHHHHRDARRRGHHLDADPRPHLARRAPMGTRTAAPMPVHHPRDHREPGTPTSAPPRRARTLGHPRPRCPHRPTTTRTSTNARPTTSPSRPDDPQHGPGTRGTRAPTAVGTAAIPTRKNHAPSAPPTPRNEHWSRVDERSRPALG